MHHSNRGNKDKRVLSSVGSEHLVYTQRVGGSNPSGPTEKETKPFKKIRVLSSVGSEHLVYTQRVGGSNPSGPTEISQVFGRFFLFYNSSLLFMGVYSSKLHSEVFNFSIERFCSSISASFIKVVQNISVMLYYSLS